jgi:hypothetical protein
MIAIIMNIMFAIWILINLVVLCDMIHIDELRVIKDELAEFGNITLFHSMAIFFLLPAYLLNFLFYGLGRYLGVR